MSSIVQSYQISVPDSAIERLQKKLSLATFPGQTTYSNDWKYGAPLEDVKQLVDFWRNEYDWRKTEAEINKLPQFTTRVSVDGHEDDLKIHFIHQKSEKPDSIPLLFIGAGSFLEVTKILPFLTSDSNGSEQTFHVVAPSMPNCGFSQMTSKPGFGIPQYAEVCHKLMIQLGLYTNIYSRGQSRKGVIGDSSSLAQWDFSTQAMCSHRI